MGNATLKKEPWRELTQTQLESFELLISRRDDAPALRLQLIRARTPKALDEVFREIQRPVKRRKK